MIRLNQGCLQCPAQKHCIFLDLSERSFEEFKNLSQDRAYSSGRTLFRQGQRPEGVHLIRVGVVSLLYAASNGREVATELAKPAKLLGLPEVVCGTEHNFTAETLEDCEVEFLPRRLFVPFLFKTPKLALSLLIRANEELQVIRDRLCSTLTGEMSPRRQLLSIFHDLATACGEPTDDGTLLSIPLTVQKLAVRLGLSRQWTTRVIQDLEEEGLLIRGGRRYVLTARFFSVVQDPDPPS